MNQDILRDTPTPIYKGWARRNRRKKVDAAKAAAFVLLVFLLGSLGVTYVYSGPDEGRPPKSIYDGWHLKWTVNSPKILIVCCECDKCKHRLRPRTFMVGSTLATKAGMNDVFSILYCSFDGDKIPEEYLKNPNKILDREAGDAVWTSHSPSSMVNLDKFVNELKKAKAWEEKDAQRGHH
jgi:hypothetical protein